MKGGHLMLSREPKLLDHARNTLRRKHYSYQTEKRYLDWIRRFIIFHDKRHPKTMGQKEIEAFLTHLAVEGKVAASTHPVLPASTWHRCT